MNQDPNLKRLMVVGSVVFVGIIILLVIRFLPRTEILLRMAPNTAILSIDGKDRGNVSYNQKIEVAPGEHTLKLSRDEFATEEITITAEKNKTTEVLIALTPQTDNAWAILRSDPNSIAIFEGYGAKKSADLARKLEQANPLYKKLPLNTREYYAYLCPSLKDFTNQLKRSICVDLVNDNEQVRQNALTALQNLGFDGREEIYISTDPKARPIITTPSYDVTYYQDLNANNKPTFAFLIKPQASAGDYQAQLVPLKDKALADFRTMGFSEQKSNIVYINPELIDYNTSEDVFYPSVAH